MVKISLVAVLVLLGLSVFMVNYAEAINFWISFGGIPNSATALKGDSSLATQIYKSNGQLEPCKTLCKGMSGCTFFVFQNISDPYVYHPTSTCYFYGSSYSLTPVNVYYKKSFQTFAHHI